ncbi:hypothetical protein [Stenotrophomonas sp. 278]|uniref:hypothetical protein n=1 Tax=Stenotrophomonas sp. 278 TaxID=2479851 RepID=UPI000F67F820|nr:hypothetical protein [Stenotrophomonas sp. 278]RRU19746.1 hypothetical protein EGJ34_05745 [Stenotrophomonas sp. 278]
MSGFIGDLIEGIVDFVTDVWMARRQRAHRGRPNRSVGEVKIESATQLFKGHVYSITTVARTPVDDSGENPGVAVLGDRNIQCSPDGVVPDVAFDSSPSTTTAVHRRAMKFEFVGICRCQRLHNGVEALL